MSFVSSVILRHTNRQDEFKENPFEQNTSIPGIMEGYLIRVPNEACIPDSRPVWRQRSDASSPVYSRVLYYIVEEGFLRGYKSPSCHHDEPVESFQLTSYRIEINVMHSINLFEIKANVVSRRQLDDDTCSDSSDDNDDCTKQMTPPKPSTLPKAITSNYHIFFLAPSKDLVQKWSVKLLNWNRFVFSSYNPLDSKKLQQSKADIIESLRVVSAADRLLRPIQLYPGESTSDDVENIPPSNHDNGNVTVPITILCNAIETPSTLISTDNSIPSIEIADGMKLAESSPWWIASIARSRKISSHSLRC